MTDNHPITPPPKLTDIWKNLPLSDEKILVIAARWGADQELEACCEWIDPNSVMAGELRAARRPKPPSLKEQALKALTKIEDNEATYLDTSVIRHALEALDD